MRSPRGALWPDANLYTVSIGIVRIRDVNYINSGCVGGTSHLAESATGKTRRSGSGPPNYPLLSQFPRLIMSKSFNARWVMAVCRR